MKTHTSSKEIQATILIANDSPEPLGYMRTLLEDAGYKVLTAPDGRAALETVDDEHLDMLISDVQMPYIDGFELCRQLRAREKTAAIPILLVSGALTDSVSAVEGLQCGADDYVETPFDPLPFIAKVTRLLSRGQIQEKLREAKNELKTRVAAQTAQLTEVNASLRAEASERIREREALSASEAELRSLFAAITDVIVVFDADGRYLKIAPTNSTYSHKPPDYLVGRSQHEIFPKETADFLVGHIRRALSDGCAHRMEYNLHLDGEEVWFDGSIAPLSADSVIWIARDITERKRAEAALRDSEERYRLLFENNPQPMWVFDVETLAFLAVNEAGILHYGYSREEFLSMTIKDIRPSEDLPALMQNVSRTGGEMDKPGTWRHRKKDGRVIDVEITAHKLTFAGRKAELILANDITERVRVAQMEKRRSFQVALRADVSAALAETGAPLKRTLERCTSAMVRNLGAAFARIWTLNAKGDMLELQASSGMYTHIDGAHARVPVGSFKIGLIAEERQAHLTNDVQNDPRVGDREWAKREGLVAFAGYPLIVDGRMVGVMAMFSHTRLAEDTLDSLAAIADIISQGIERKRAEEALCFQKTLLESQSEASLDAILIVSSEKKIVSFNRRLTELWGVSEDLLRTQADGLALQSILSMVARPQEFLERVEYLYQHPDEASQEEILLNDGRVLDRYSAPVKNSDGFCYGRVWFFRDITERKRTEAALRESEQRFQLIARGTNDVVWDWELSTGKVWWNENVYKQLGHAPGDVVMDATWWYEHIHPADVERAVTSVDKAINGGLNTWSGEYRFQRADGSYADIFDRGYMIHDGKGSPVRILGCMMDVTESKRAEQALRQSEEKYRSLVANIPDVTWTSDSQGKTTFISPNVERVYGYTAEEILQFGNEFWFGRLHPEDVERVKNAYGLLFNRDGTFDVEYRVKRKDGQWIWIHDKAVTTYEKNGVLFTDGMFSDVTERKILEDQLRQAQKLESLGQLAAGVAHEINTPTQYVGDNTRFLQDAFKDLTSALEAYQSLVQGATDSLKPELLQHTEEVVQAADLDYVLEEVPKAIQQALDGVGRITTIVQSMKDFAHPGSNEKKGADLNRAIESTVTVARNEWKYVADMNLDLDLNLPLVPCLVGEFNQVILNMIINASHAIAEKVVHTGGKGVINISTRHDGDHVVVNVQDTGYGVPAAIRSRIFDPFFTTKEVGKGTGQGLSISHRVIVEKHGGSLSFETTEGAGTTFTIRLPLTSNHTIS